MSPLDGYAGSMTSNGRILVPALLRKLLGFQDGEPLLFIPEEDGFKVSSPRLTWQRLRKLVQESAPAKTLLVDDLLNERRKEAAQDGF